VVRAAGGVYTVVSDGEALECALRGRLKRASSLGRVVVGDEVEVAVFPDGSAAIVGVHPRRTKISRRAAHGTREQVLVANVDRLAAVFAARAPDPNFLLLDRWLAIAEWNGIEALVVVNKIDLTGADAARAMFATYERIGYPVLYVSAVTGAGLDALADALRGRVTAFVGPSGAGKSTLLNAIEPGLGLRVGAVSRKLGTGRHTTVAASLHPLRMGGYVADTPGLSLLKLHEFPEGALDLAFREFRTYREGCRFADCRHLEEPDCAVREAVARGAIAESRYRSYRAILAEREEARPY
jgi:ribosome biogenesis GTPase